MNIPDFVREFEGLNLFVTDPDPQVSAQSLDDKRVGKLLMECNQMLSLAVKRHRPDVGNDPRNYGDGKLCQGGAYATNPVTLWVGENRDNWIWTWKYAAMLREEWIHRFINEHVSGLRVHFIWSFNQFIPEGELQPFYNGAKHKMLNLDFTYLKPPASYRHYLNARWARDERKPKWTNREPPSWARLT